MNFKLLNFLLIIFVITGTVFSNELSIKQSRIKQLNQAHGFILGQQMSLDMIQKQFPRLDKDVKRARFAFNSTALGEGGKGVEQELSKIFGDKWPKYKKDMMVKVDALMKKQSISKIQAVDFLKEVHKRSKGDMPAPILACLLSANPEFTKNPALELSNGWKQIFRTKGHKKSKGVDFSISFPASWSKKEGNRPNIIQCFNSSAGHGLVFCNLLVKTIPFPQGYKPTKDELKEFFQPNILKKMAPPGSTYITAKELVLEGSPAGMLVVDVKKKRLDLEVSMRMTQYVTIQDKSMIFIQFAVSKMPSSTESIDDIQKHYFPLFQRIVNTLVFNDRYK